MAQKGPGLASALLAACRSYFWGHAWCPHCVYWDWYWKLQSTGFCPQARIATIMRTHGCVYNHLAMIRGVTSWAFYGRRPFKGRIGPGGGPKQTGPTKGLGPKLAWEEKFSASFSELCFEPCAFGQECVPRDGSAQFRRNSFQTGATRGGCALR